MCQPLSALCCSQDRICQQIKRAQLFVKLNVPSRMPAPLIVGRNYATWAPLLYNNTVSKVQRMY